MDKDKIFEIVKSEIKFEPARLNNKNKNQEQKDVEVRGWWNFAESKKLSLAQKNSIARFLKDHLARNGVLAATYKKHPTWEKNSKEVFLIMSRMVAKALKGVGHSVFKRNNSKVQQDILIGRGRR